MGLGKFLLSTDTFVWALTGGIRLIHWWTWTALELLVTMFCIATWTRMGFGDSCLGSFQTLFAVHAISACDSSHSLAPGTRLLPFSLCSYTYPPICHWLPHPIPGSSWLKTVLFCLTPVCLRQLLLFFNFSKLHILTSCWEDESFFGATGMGRQADIGSYHMRGACVTSLGGVCLRWQAWTFGFGLEEEETGHEKFGGAWESC